MYCQNCGKKLLDRANFCGNCGNKIPIRQETVAPTYYNSPPVYASGIENTQREMQKKDENKKVKNGCLIALLVVVISIVAIFAALIFIGELLPDQTDVVTTFTEEGDSLYTGTGNYGDQLDIENLRDFYTVLNGDGTDVTTLMMYFIGSDLETDGGFASSDIYEMLEAEISDNVNLILMTGGSYDWYIDEISDDSCQYWQIKDGELVLLEDVGSLNMSSSETLSDFINYSSENFPATRYSLILWNHGGGTFGGFGYDEHYPDDTLTLSSLSTAFSSIDIKFDFIGFDACLMGTAETALMLEPYADYLIASQELEPGIGWYYTNWLTNLSLYPSVSTVDLGANIVDDFVLACEYEMFNPNATLSVVELRQMPYTYVVMTDFFAEASEYIQNNEYRKLSVARSDAKNFGDGEYEQIDIVDYINKAEIEGGDKVISAINSAVKYYNSSEDVYDANGLAMYFPYDYPSYYSDIQTIMHNVGVGRDYTNFFDLFVSAMTGGQIQTAQHDDYVTEDWYDDETATTYHDEFNMNSFEELIIDEKGDDYVLSLSDEQWENINTIALQVLLDDGEGMYDLGSDNVYAFDYDGDLIIDFDYTWVSLDGVVVPFYFEEEYYGDDDSWQTYGMVPAFLNEQDYIEIVVYWDNDVPEGYVAGYRKFTETGEPAGKGLFELKPGDTLEYVYDYYTYDWELEDYLFSNIYTISDSDIEVGYSYVGDEDAIIYFVLTDYFNNVYETEAVVFSDY